MTAGVLAWIGLGANLADPVKQVESALTELGALPETRLLARSRLYLSPPMGPPGQPEYVNAVARIETRLAPYALLTALQGIEQAHGRVRAQHWGPRTLDLDLLLYGDWTSSDPKLVVPHPGIAKRAFVLFPLAEVASPDLIIPGLGALAERVRSCDLGGLRTWGEPPVQRSSDVD